MNTEVALLGYIAWTLLLVLTLALWRGYEVVINKRAATSFARGASDPENAMSRLCAAYYNCAENFPVFGGLLLFALIQGLTDITDGLALVFLIARIVQSTAHVCSASAMAINIRFGAFCVQLGIGAIWVVLISAKFF